MVVNHIFVKLVLLLTVYTHQLAGASDENLCPGINVLFSCSSAGALAWSGTAFEGECTGTSLTFSPSDFDTSQCGQFSFNNTITNGSNPLFPDAMGLSSAIMFTTDLGTLNGETVMCSVPADPSPRVDVTLRIQDLTATSLMFTQLNTTSGEFSWEVDQGSMCDMTFVVTVTGNGFMREYRDDLTSTIANFEDTLSPGTYTFTVSTISGNSVFISSPQEFTLILKAPPSPFVMTPLMNISCADIDVTISWEEPMGNTTFTPPVIYYMITNGRTDEVIIDRIETNVVNIKQHVVVGNRTLFSVIAVNRIGNSKPGNISVYVPSPVLSDEVSNVDTSSALIQYTVNISCIGDMIRTVARECTTPQQCSVCEGPIAISSDKKEITDPTSVQTQLIGLTSGVKYCYCAVIFYSDQNLTICNISETTITATRPQPPARIQGAQLYEEMTREGELPNYKCSNPLHGFNGGSSTLTASFDVTNQRYTLSATCSLLNSFIAGIIVLIIIVVGSIAAAIAISVSCCCCCKERCKKWRIKFIAICCPCFTNKGEKDTNILHTEDAHEMKSSATYGEVDHEKHPETGDEYAVVTTKTKDDHKSADVQGLYQDPNTIQHEQAAGGDLYAVAERPKKGSKKEKSEQELAGMYSVPDKKNKSQLTYADIDVGVGSRKPMNPVPEMEYATVVN